MDRSSVEEEVRSAFHGVSLGSGIGLWEAQAIDDYESEEVRRQQRERDRKGSWELIPSAELQRCHSSLSFFDADGMRFHLPAYIIASLRGEVDDPIFHLVHLDEYATSKLTSLSDLQRMSIISYLKFCLERDEYEFEHASIEKALDEYWEH